MREALIGQDVNARMHTMSFTLSGSSPSLAFKNKKEKRKIKKERSWYYWQADYLLKMID